MSSPSLFDACPEAAGRPGPVAYACPACPNTVTIHVEHHHAPTCSGAGRHRPATMKRKEHAR